MVRAPDFMSSSLAHSRPSSRESLVQILGCASTVLPPVRWDSQPVKFISVVPFIGLEKAPEGRVKHIFSFTQFASEIDRL